MKYIRNNDFVMREIVGESFLIPIGDIAREFNGMITLNNMSAFIWKKVENACTVDDLVKAIMEIYEAEESQVKVDVQEFIARMKQMKMLEEIAE